MSVAGRGVSTVADVTLALLLLSAATVLLVTFVENDERHHDPMETEYTGQTVSAVTTNVTYDVERAVEAYYGGAIPEEADYGSRDVRRVSHGPVATQIADVAVANAVSDLGIRQGSPTSSPVAADFHRLLDEKLQGQLVNDSFETHVSAVWEPLDGGPISGATTVGQTPPRHTDVSATTITVPGDMPDVRGEALDAVSAPDDFDVVADTVAGAIIRGYFPLPASQRALERSGVERDLTVARYENAAAALGVGDEITDHLDPERANATGANAVLRAELAAQLTAYLEPATGPPANGPLGDARAAAAAVSTGEVTITVRAWT